MYTTPTQPPELYKFLFCSLSALLLLCVLQTCVSVDTISANQTISDGETIVSAGERFEMGFFSPGNSRNRYVGIWYKTISPQTVVWVANRDTPITNTSGGSGGVLRLNPSGVLEIQNTTNSLIWSSNSSGSVRNPVAQLLDNGNFIIKDESDRNPDNIIWQSFDFPVDSLLPSMKVGKNLVTGRQWSYTSWKSADDPSPGNFTTFIDTNGYPQMILMRGSDIVLRSGPWNGIRFSGEPNMRPNQFHTYEFVFSQREIYYHDEEVKSVITRSVIRPGGDVTRFIWLESSQQWTVYASRQTDSCDNYGLCGVYGSCNINNFPACGCLEGFEPRFPQQWNVANWSGGCQRRTPLGCLADEGFRKYSDKKLPDTTHSWYNLTMNLDECQQLCKSNCSCTAYANTDIRGSGSGCVLWFDELFDTRDFPNAGQDIFIRMAASELILVTSQRNYISIYYQTLWKKTKVLKQVRIIIPVILALVILLGLLLLLVLKRRRPKREAEVERLQETYTTEVQKDDLELPLFGLSTLLTATGNFSFNSKLGEGGFGPVYKGVLEEGQEVAVKRLSKTSSQGLDEFKNEVICISKLQHRNLVKLLGCCIEGEEKMLVYEYMENKSLDFYIFDKTQRTLLNWPQRWHIINGIARGLLYLHQDSRLRIIHRDLKASNILLDSNMNPKISDFGMARRFGENEIQANTIRVVGTYGYMSPEYAGEGIFSVKSDAFSFGVLVLEILSGKRNRGFSHQDHNHNLLGHAWRLYQEGRSLELVDATLVDSIDSNEVLRAIQVGLLCVQQDPDDRPLMSSVVLMLGSEGAICTPKHPGFFNKRTVGDENCSSSTLSNEATITMLNGR